jgi:hypothetical protein
LDAIFRKRTDNTMEKRQTTGWVNRSCSTCDSLHVALVTNAAINSIQFKYFIE